MTHDDVVGEISPDPRIAAAMRAIEGDVPYDAVDWTALQERIRADAAGPLRALRLGRMRAWWEYTAGWAQTAIPIGVVAALAASMLAVVLTRASTGMSAIPTTISAPLISAVAGAGSVRTLLDAVVEPVNGDSLLAVAVYQ